MQKYKINGVLKPKTFKWTQEQLDMFPIWAEGCGMTVNAFVRFVSDLGMEVLSAKDGFEYLPQDKQAVIAEMANSAGKEPKEFLKEFIQILFTV